MPAQDLLSLGYGNVTEFKQETNDLVKSLIALKAAAKDVEGTIGNFGNFGAGIKDFKQASDQLAQSQNKLADATDQYNKIALQQAKISKANADAQKAQVAADNEVIKQISLEADAEKKLAASKQATAKASKQKADAQASENIPFTSNLNADGSINEPSLGVTTGPVVNEEEVKATKEQLAAEAALNAEKQKAIGIDAELAPATAKFTSEIELQVAALIDDENALIANKAAQKELIAAGAGSAVATAEQTTQLVGLRKEQFALNESISTTRANIKNLTKEFLSDEGSIIELRAQVNRLTREYEGLSAAEKQSASGINLKSQIQTLQPALKTAESELGNFTRNVGNYTGGIQKFFSGAFSQLRTLAAILPGIGLAGLIGLASDAIVNLISNFTNQSKASNQAAADLDSYAKQVEQTKISVIDLNKELEFTKALFDANTRLRFGQNFGTDVAAANTSLGVLIAQYDNLRNASDKAGDAAEAAKIKYSDIAQLDGSESDDAKEALTKLNEIIKTRDDLLDQTLEKQKQVDLARIAVTQAQQKLDEDTAKKAIDESQKLSDAIFANTKAQLLAEIDKANKIRDNDKILYSYRDEAAEKSFNLTNRLIKLEEENRKRASDTAINNIKLQEQYGELTAEQAQTLIQVELQKRKGASIEATNAIYKNEQDLNDKLDTIFRDRFKMESNAQPLTPKQYYDEELKKLEDAHNRGLISEEKYKEKFNEISSGLFALLPADQQIAQQLAKQKEVNEKLIQQVEAAGEDRVNIIAKSQAEANTKLNDEYAQGLISAEQYEKGKRDIAIKYAKEALEALIHIKESELLLDKQGNASTNTIDKLTADIAKLKEQLSELGVSTTENLGNDLIGNLEKIAEATQNVSQAFTDLSEISLNNQIVQLEEIGAKEEKNYEQEQQNIQNSTLSQEDKANALKVLDAEHNAQQEKIQRQEKQYNNQKAKFDRDASILNIITGTLASAAKAGWVTPVAIAIEIAGAAGLIKALATKIPSYFKGKDKTTKSEWALTDELGPELYIEPSGNMFLGNDKPTLRYLQAGTQVIPSDEVNQILHFAMLKKAGQSAGTIKEAVPDKFDYDKMRRAFADVMRMQKRPTINRRDLSAIGGEISLKNAMQEWKNMGKRN
jgi:hypothetical protein